MDCCDGNRNTPYCPMCGRSLNESPPQSLLAHLDKYVDRNQKWIDERDKDDDRRAFVDRGRARINQWKSWRQFVANAIKAGITEDPTP